jgi:hypothetical protein
MSGGQLKGSPTANFQMKKAAGAASISNLHAGQKNITNTMIDKMLKKAAQPISQTMAGNDVIGPKKIHVFPKKKKFPDKPRSPGGLASPMDMI